MWFICLLWFILWEILGFNICKNFGVNFFFTGTIWTIAGLAGVSRLLFKKYGILFFRDEKSTIKFGKKVQIWLYKVRPLPWDLEQYIDWSFYNFETTDIRADILMKMYKYKDDERLFNNINNVLKIFYGAQE